MDVQPGHAANAQERLLSKVVLMRSIRKWFPISFGLAILAGVAYLIWSVFGTLFAWIGSQGSEVITTVIAATATIIAALIAVVVSQQWTKKREIAESHRQQKIDLYTPFIKMVMDQMQRQKNSGSKDAAANLASVDKFFRKFTTDLVLWGSPKFVRSYLKFRKAAKENSTDDLVLAMDDLIRALRKDLGHSDWLLPRGDLIKTFLTDPEEIDKMLQESAAG